MPKYTQKRRSAAASRGWETRRTKMLAQPEYTKVNLPKVAPSEVLDLAAELPLTVNSLAGGVAKWEDPILELDPLAYVKMRRCPAIKKTERKLAIRTTKLNWTIVSGLKAPEPEEAPSEPDVQMAAPVIKLPTAQPDPAAMPAKPKKPKSKRAEAVKEIFAQIRGWYNFIYHFTGSTFEGTRFMQILTAPAREGSSEAWQVPSFEKAGRHRYNAGGDIEWDGGMGLYQVDKTTGVADRKAGKLPIDPMTDGQFAIHSPGPSSNPEGDLDLGVALYNGVVVPWTRGMTSGDLWVRLFAVPAVLLGAKIDRARPDRIAAMLEARAAQMSNAIGNNPGSTTALKSEEVVQLLQAEPSGLTGIVAWQQYLEGLADDIVTLAALTSSAGVSQANRTGDTSEQKDNEDEAAFANAVQIAETFNKYVLPWIIRKNPDLPKLEEGEQEVYLWPDDPSDEDEQDVGVEDEAMMPESDVEATAAMFERMERAYQARGDRASVALAAFSPLPPVHP